jgi:undecaprenyl diphosphate synthase
MPSSAVRHRAAAWNIEHWNAAERESARKLDPKRLPRHVAIIMDGNGRWAKLHGFRQRIEGHRAGIGAVRSTTETCAELGLRALTLYAFSKENWNRPAAEVKALMFLLENFLDAERTTLMKNNVRLVTSGHVEDLSESVRRVLRETVELTSANTRLTLNLALSYSGREEIVDAARLLARQVARGSLSPEAITAETFSRALYHSELGDPDLLIRTSGEMRVSNFLLWQIAYAELYITPVLWPDFQRIHLLEALMDYQQRERRYGKVSG